MRMNFITKYSITKYLGQAQAYFPKTPKSAPFKRNPLDEVVRLLFEAKRLCYGQDLMVKFNGEERDYIMSIKRKQLGDTEILAHVKQILVELEKKKQEFQLLEAEQKPINDWLIRVRKVYLMKELEQGKKN